MIPLAREDRSWTSKDTNTDIPNPARMYDYFLGGYHNFEADRAAARKVIETNPNTLLVMQANRAFVRRAVRYLIEVGVRQFLDVGSGIPTVGNVHEVAQNMAVDARVVYVDAEPVAVRHSEMLLRDNPNASAIRVDARDTKEMLEHGEVRRLINFAEPVGILICSVLPFIPNDEEAYAIVCTLSEALPVGGYLAISHATFEGTSQEEIEAIRGLYGNTSNPVQMRSKANIEVFFEGLEFVEPGLVNVPQWRPESPDDPFYDRPELSSNYGAVGYKA